MNKLSRLQSQRDRLLNRFIKFKISEHFGTSIKIGIL